jgi:hypothetical protein
MRVHRIGIPTDGNFPLGRWRRPLLQNLCPLPNGQADTRPMVDSFRKNLSRLVEPVSSVKHVVDLGAVLGPLLDFVKVAMVRDDWVVGFFVRHVRCGWTEFRRQIGHIGFPEEVPRDTTEEITGRRLIPGETCSAVWAKARDLANSTTAMMQRGARR